MDPGETLAPRDCLSFGWDAPLTPPPLLRFPFQATDRDLSGFGASDVAKLSSHQLVEFLALLLQEVTRGSFCQRFSRRGGVALALAAGCSF